MEKEGVIERSTSPWASPLHMVPKKDRWWRPCGDFRRLNLVTEPDVYPLPNMLDFSDRLSGCTVFSKIDLRKGYWQVPVRPEDRKKTAIITPFGLFQFRRMPFGLRNAGSSFQRMMDRVLAGLPFTYCYLDDLHIASTSPHTCSTCARFSLSSTVRSVFLLWTLLSSWAIKFRHRVLSPSAVMWRLLRRGLLLQQSRNCKCFLALSIFIADSSPGRPPSSSH